jgi:competence protein ComEC
MKSTGFRFILLLLALLASVIWLAVLSYPSRTLQIIACNVGQGDASLVIWRNKQILIDGGPGRDVVDCVSSNMPFWDRKIEVVILSHPQKDHFGGLIEIFKRYNVDLFVANSLESSTEDYQVLKNEVGGGGVRVVNPAKGMVVRLGLMHLDILWPTEKFLARNYKAEDGSKSSVGQNVLGVYTSKKDPNEFSVVALLNYGDFDALFTGDIDNEISNIIADEIMSSEVGEVEYIKIPHHGSKNGASEDLISKLHPRIAIISVGENNSYGHPHKEVLDLLSKYEVKTLRTDEMGDVIIETDGDSFWMIK